MNTNRVTKWFVYILMGVAVAAIFWSLNSKGETSQPISISELAQQIQANEVSELQVSGNGRQVEIVYVDISFLNCTLLCYHY